MHAGTAEPLRVSPPEAVAYLLEVVQRHKNGQLFIYNDVGLAVPQREAAENRHTAWLEDSRFREPNAVSVALEEAGDANALGVIATETGVDAVDLLEPIDE